MGESNKFIRDDADRSLQAMVDNVTPARALTALITGGVGYSLYVIRYSIVLELVTIGTLVNFPTVDD